MTRGVMTPERLEEIKGLHGWSNCSEYDIRQELVAEVERLRLEEWGADELRFMVEQQKKQILLMIEHKENRVSLLTRCAEMLYTTPCQCKVCDWCRNHDDPCPFDDDCPMDVLYTDIKKQLEGE